MSCVLSSDLNSVCFCGSDESQVSVRSLVTEPGCDMKDDAAHTAHWHMRTVLCVCLRQCASRCICVLWVRMSILVCVCVCISDRQSMGSDSDSHAGEIAVSSALYQLTALFTDTTTLHIMRAACETFHIHSYTSCADLYAYIDIYQYIHIVYRYIGLYSQMLKHMLNHHCLCLYVEVLCSRYVYTNTLLLIT